MKTYLRGTKRRVPATVLTYFGKPLPRIKITASEFNAMIWNSGALHTDLIQSPEQKRNRDKQVEAHIQIFVMIDGANSQFSKRSI